MQVNRVYSAARIRRAILHFLGGKLVQALAAAALLLVIVRLLSRSDYGAYITVLGIVEMMMPLTSFGLTQAAQRFLPEAAGRVPRASVYRLIVALLSVRLAVLLVVGGACWLAWTGIAPRLNFDAQQAGATLWVTVLVVLVPGFRFMAEMLEALLEQGSAQLSRALVPVGKLAALAVLAMVTTTITLEHILIIETIVIAAAFLLAGLLLARRLRTLPEGASVPPTLGRILRFAWHLAIIGWLNVTTNLGTLRVVVAGSLGLAEAGLFGFLQTIAEIIGRYLPANLFRPLVRPVLTSRFKASGDIGILSTGASLLWKLNLLILGMAWVVTAGAGDWLIALASDGKYPSAGLTFLLMLVGLASGSLRVILDMVMQITDHTRELITVALLGPVILTAVLLVSGWGLNAIIIVAAIVGTVTMNAINLRTLTHEQVGFRMDWRGGVIVSLAAAISIATGITISMNWGLLQAGLASLLGYIVILKLFRPLAAMEIRMIEKGIGGWLSRPLMLFARD